MKYNVMALLLGAQLLWPSISFATDYYVHANIGNNTNSGLHPDDAFADLAHATRQLQPGDTLFLRAGTYHDLPILRSEFHSSGTSSSPITIKSYANEVATISSDVRTGIKDLSWWIFKGLVFEISAGFKIGLNDSSLPASSQCISFAENITLKNNRFQHGSGAIGAPCTRHLRIVDNTFDNIRSRIEGVDAFAIMFHYKADDVVISGNLFRDIGADGIHMLDRLGGQFTNFQITDNEFEVVRPYRYRDENGNVVPVDQQPFSNVGENGIDIKQGPGPIVISNNRFHGFSPSSSSGQDASGGGGSGIGISQVARGITISRNYFYDNVKHLTSGRGTNTTEENIDRDLVISNNIFEEKTIVDYFEPYYKEGIHIEDARNVSIFNNTFKYLLSDRKRILLIFNKISNVSLYNNIFQNGTAYINSDGNMGLNADYNAWSGIMDKEVTDRNAIATLRGIHDVWADDLMVDWATKTPLTDSPLIDAALPLLDIMGDFNGAPVTGLAPDIGAIEYQESEQGSGPDIETADVLDTTASDNSGGGCSINTSAKMDPVWLFLILASAAGFIRRRLSWPGSHYL